MKRKNKRKQNKKLEMRELESQRSKHFLREIRFVICSQWVRLGCGPFVFVCAFAIPGTVLSVLSRSRRLSFPRACVVWPHWFLEIFSG